MKSTYDFNKIANVFAVAPTELDTYHMTFLLSAPTELLLHTEPTLPQPSRRRRVLDQIAFGKVVLPTEFVKQIKTAGSMPLQNLFTLDTNADTNYRKTNHQRPLQHTLYAASSAPQIIVSCESREEPLCGTWRDITLFDELTLHIAPYKATTVDLIESQTSRTYQAAILAVSKL